MTATEAVAPVLELVDVHVFYGKVEALKGISFSVAQGEIVTLIGANGAGKTTTLKTISGVRPVTSGQVLFEGRDIRSIPAHKRTELGICQAPEGRGIFPGMTVVENLDMGTYALDKAQRATKGADLERVFGLFPRLAERRGQAAGTLSGGEQQMLAIGRLMRDRPMASICCSPSSRRGAPPCCSWSRTPRLRSGWPTAVTCWRPAASCCRGRAPTCFATRASARRIWARIESSERRFHRARSNSSETSRSSPK